MKIIDAVWEKRNLGVDTMEFEIDASDRIDEAVSTILANEKQYNVIKSPAGDLALNQALSANGYIFGEMMLNIANDIRRINVLPIHQRICDEIGYAPMDEDDLRGLFHELEKGLFKTDRIALDPKFSVDIANRRYINWIKDEVESGTQVYKQVYRGKTFNFFVCKKISEKVYSPFLGGTYEKYIKGGLGIPCALKSIEICKSKGAQRMISSVSANNYTALRTNLAVGYHVDKVVNVWFKHNG